MSLCYDIINTWWLLCKQTKYNKVNSKWVFQLVHCITVQWFISPYICQASALGILATPKQHLICIVKQAHNKSVPHKRTWWHKAWWFDLEWPCSTYLHVHVTPDLQEFKNSDNMLLALDCCITWNYSSPCLHQQECHTSIYGITRECMNILFV